MSTAAVAQIEVTASVDRNQVAVGESLGLEITVSGDRNAAAPNMGNLEGFQARYVGPSTQVSIVNGQVSSSVGHRYALVARQAGVFQLGPFRVDYDGNTYDSNTVQVRVTAQPRAGSGNQADTATQGVRLVLAPAKQQAFVGERVPLQVKLYIGNVRVDDLQFPAIKGDGVVTDKLDQPSRGAEMVGGVRYQTLGFTTAMTALRPGEVDLTATMAMSLLVPRRGGAARGGLFDDFFGNALADRRAVEVQAEAVRLSVLPLPDEGRPADFSGALGSFDFTMTAKPTEVAVGDPVTVQMRINGQGDLARVSPPRIPVDDTFRVYDPVPVREAENESTRVFEQVLIPKQAVSELPAVRFSYFDPGTASYRTITRGPIPLKVEAAAVSDRPQVFAADAGAVPAPVRQILGRDLVYIKDTPGRLAARAAPLHVSAWFLGLQSIPLAGFLALFLQVRRRERFAADPGLLRFRQAGRMVQQRLARLSKDGEESAVFYDELSAALLEYLGAKFGLPPGGVERERVQSKLVAAGAANELGGQVGRFFDLLERIRYAPDADGRGQRAQALELAGRIVDRVERLRGIGAPGRVRISVLLGGAVTGVLLLAGTALLAAPDQQPQAGGEPFEPNRAFFQGNSAYADSRYGDAVRAYEQVHAAGLASGPLYFNLANAYFKDGRIGEAILNYQRAKRFGPRDPDVDANLSYAREVAEIAAEPAPLWQRLVFAPAFRATTGELAVLGSILWFGLWLCLSLRLYLPRLRLVCGRAAATTALLVGVVAASLVYRAAVLEPEGAAIVTVAGDTPVRFEPSDSGTAHFSVPEGTVLVITEEREGWSQVRRADGLRGWVPSDRLTRV